MAFNAIYNRYWKVLYSYIYNILNDKGLTEDSLQDVFYAIWIKRDDLQITSLKSYLFNAARNNAISKIRKKKFTLLQENILEDFYVTIQADAEQNLGVQDLKSTIHQILKSLPKRCRSIFYLSRYHNITIQEIAIHFNISHRTVENQLHLALKHLKSNLGKKISIILFIISYSLHLLL